MYAMLASQNRVGYGCFQPQQPQQQHGRPEHAELKASSTDGSSALHQKGSQPENSVSTCLGSTASDYQPTGEICLPSDLQLFSNLLDGHLATAWKALIERDGDVAYLITTALAHKTSLLEQASRAVETIQSGGRQVHCFVPGLRTAAVTRKRHVALSAIEMVQACVVSVKKNLADMRASYVALLEQVHYLIDCTVVELDYVSQFEDLGSHTATAGRDMQEELRNFELALDSLRGAEDVMGGCFDSWLYLHSIELNARELDKGAQRLRQDLLEGRVHDAFPAGFEAFCAALEQLDEQCAHVLQC